MNENDITVIELDAEYDGFNQKLIDETSAMLLSEADSHEPPRLVLDMSRTQYVGSSFVELLVRVCRRVNARGGQMAVFGASAFVSEVFRVLQLDTVWSVLSTRDEAIAKVAE